MWRRRRTVVRPGSWTDVCLGDSVCVYRGGGVKEVKEGGGIRRDTILVRFFLLSIRYAKIDEM